MKTTFLIQLREPIEISELNAMSPHQMTLAALAAPATLVSIQTDQSGMIGVLQHLHNLGLTILRVEVI